MNESLQRGRRYHAYGVIQQASPRANRKNFKVRHQFVTLVTGGIHSSVDDVLMYQRVSTSYVILGEKCKCISNSTLQEETACCFM